MTTPHHPEAASLAPTGATAAVLKPSDPVPEGAREVKGIDFDNYAHRSITIDELVGGMTNMGFQATSVGEAVRIINDMVSGSSSNQYAGTHTVRLGPGQMTAND